MRLRLDHNQLFFNEYQNSLELSGLFLFSWQYETGFVRYFLLDLYQLEPVYLEFRHNQHIRIIMRNIFPD